MVYVNPLTEDNYYKELADDFHPRLILKQDAPNFCQPHGLYFLYTVYIYIYMNVLC